MGGWKLNKYDDNGQCLYIDDAHNIKILYQYSEDKRPNKNELLDDYYKNEKTYTIMQWKKEDIQGTINKKWNQKGFFICKKNKDGIYYKICFGKPICFKYWMEELLKGNIFYDGYSTMNGRWRGCFRAYNTWWNHHITDEYQ